jgi:flagellar basal-body rod modification protein FlgD
MSTVNAIGGTGSAGETAKATNKEAELDKNQFLELLVAQMKNQNPLSPTNSQEYVSEMAQFSSLEQLTNVAAGTEEANQMATVSQSLSLVGKQVSYTKEDGTAAEGKVESVEFAEGGFTLTIAGEAGIQAGNVTKVAE